MLEGVTKFEAVHENADPVDRRRTAELLAWRRILFALGLIGRDPNRYDGAAYGNLSVRVGAPSAPRGRRSFIITGTQTGGDKLLDSASLCTVSGYDIGHNKVCSYGPARPSSESMTHGAVYDLSPVIRWVFHAHSPQLWSAAKAQRLPTTARDVAYGTPEMAREITRLYRETRLADCGVLAMGGHEDGVIAFGRTAAEAANRLTTSYAEALVETRP